MLICNSVESRDQCNSNEAVKSSCMVFSPFRETENTCKGKSCTKMQHDAKPWMNKNSIQFFLLQIVTFPNFLLKFVHNYLSSVADKQTNKPGKTWPPWHRHIYNLSVNVGIRYTCGDNTELNIIITFNMLCCLWRYYNYQLLSWIIVTAMKTIYHSRELITLHTTTTPYRLNGTMNHYTVMCEWLSENLVWMRYWAMSAVCRRKTWFFLT